MFSYETQVDFDKIEKKIQWNQSTWYFQLQTKVLVHQLNFAFKSKLRAEPPPYHIKTPQTVNRSDQDDRLIRESR